VVEREEGVRVEDSVEAGWVAVGLAEGLAAEEGVEGGWVVAGSEEGG
jgi:hypothetical protein